MQVGAKRAKKKTCMQRMYNILAELPFCVPPLLVGRACVRCSTVARGAQTAATTKKKNNMLRQVDVHVQKASEEEEKERKKMKQQTSMVGLALLQSGLETCSAIFFFVWGGGRVFGCKDPNLQAHHFGTGWLQKAKCTTW